MQHSAQRWFRAVIGAVAAAVAVIAARQYLHYNAARQIQYNLEYEPLIDGKKHPELIPEYHAWESGLRMLASASRHTPSGILDRVGLSDADLQLVLHEAKEQATRDKQCEEQAETVKPLLDVVPTPYAAPPRSVPRSADTGPRQRVVAHDRASGRCWARSGISVASGRRSAPAPGGDRECGTGGGLFRFRDFDPPRVIRSRAFERRDFLLRAREVLEQIGR
jgi:hypothetical protein